MIHSRYTPALALLAASLLCTLPAGAQQDSAMPPEVQGVYLK